MDKIIIDRLSLCYGGQQVLRSISMTLPAGGVTAVIGPSGCGKSSLLRAINRMTELSADCTVSGRICIDGTDISAVDASLLRRRVGMVFQRPNPFPMSIYDNIAYGPRTHGIRSARRLDELVESALRTTALWGELGSRLRDNAMGLSGGQQQRLCIARALAVQPEVLLLDEPTSALDPVSAAHIEAVISQLGKERTLVLVTHNLQQARRVSDRTAFILAGELVEYGTTGRIFSCPGDVRTRRYLSG